MATAPDETAQDSESDVAPLVITPPTRSADATRMVPFRLEDDDYVYTAVKPKTAVLVKVLAALGDEQNPMRQAVSLNQLIPAIMDKPSADHMMARMTDPDDTLDLLDLAAILQPLVGRWYGSPTGGGRSGSRPGPRRSGPSSTGRRRSKG